VSIHLGRTRYSAGDTVVALVDGVTPPARVALVRIEARPCGEAIVVVDQQVLREGYGVLELELPRAALPSASGASCSLSYAVELRSGGIARTGLEVIADRRTHVAVGSSGGDPLVAAWPARHFHLELEDAVLRGGAWIAGRVHRHGSWGSGKTIEVCARCDECWRPGGPVARGMPFWHDQTLWSARELIELGPGVAWEAFTFSLPPGLPPAVEARTIAWRYELRARRRRRPGPDETAALTPLLHDERDD
jgi:hypothetical protein